MYAYAPTEGDVGAGAAAGAATAAAAAGHLDATRAYLQALAALQRPNSAFDAGGSSSSRKYQERRTLFQERDRTWSASQPARVRQGVD